MSENQYQYFIGVGLPKKEDDFFIYLKKQFQKEGNNFSSPAHVTIVPPFFYKNELYLLENLKKIETEQKCFKIIFEEVDSFRQSKYGTVYLAPNKSDGFYNIFIKVHELLPHLPRKRVDHFVPHLTIANRIPLEKVDVVKNQLSQMKISLELKVDSIFLFRRKFNEGWKKFNEIKFKKDQNNPI